MNRTITTTSATRRRSLHHAALALCAVLVALVAASCTADALDGRDTPNAGNGTNPDDVLTFAVGSRPGFTEAPATRADGTKAVIPGLTRDLPNGKAGLSVQEIAGQARNDKKSAPATRAEQTPGATRWEQGDILWLIARFFHNKQDYAPDAVPDTIHVSALKYDGTAWRYLTVDEAADLHTANIPNFVRLLRWPPESAGWSDPGMKVGARYVGTGKPDTDGIITITPQGGIPVIPAIKATNELSVPGGEPVSLQFSYDNSRIRIPAGYAAKFNGFIHLITFMPSNDRTIADHWASNLPAQQQDTDVFLSLTGGSTVTLTRDGVSCSFAFPPLTDAEGNPLIDEDGSLARDGASYTLTPYTSGTETPGGYDLTIADEAGLRAFAQAVNAGEKLPNGKPAAKARVLQTADITLTAEWVPIGYDYAKTFRGAYNGNGHTITDLTITTPPANADGDIFAGLFGGADEAVLTGINLRAVEINIRAGSSTSTLCAGSIVGILSNSTLSLCSADGTVNADGGAESVSAGGIAGMITSIDEGAVTVSRCRADAGITAATTHADGVAYAGGIAGNNFGYGFILCCETGSKPVTAGAGQIARAGGITGWNTTSSLIAFCRTGTNAVKAWNATRTNSAGGLVGQNMGYLYSCYSRAEATATGNGNNYAGAIVGDKSDTPDGEQHCYAAGAADQGTSDLATGIGIVYKAIPNPGEIFGVMTNYPGKVESLIFGGKTCYPYTTHYDPSATPAYGIIPQRAVWKSDGAWNIGDGTYPKLNIEEYEGK